MPLLLCHRCLRRGAGDVAFVDHLALESVEGKAVTDIPHLRFLGPISSILSVYLTKDKMAKKYS